MPQRWVEREVGRPECARPRAQQHPHAGWRRKTPTRCCAPPCCARGRAHSVPATSNPTRMRLARGGWEGKTVCRRIRLHADSVAALQGVLQNLCAEPLSRLKIKFIGVDFRHMVDGSLITTVPALLADASFSRHDDIVAAFLIAMVAA